MRILSILFFLAILNGCAINQKTGMTEYRPEAAINKMQKEFDTLPPPNGRKVTVAVYSFQDKTGQRKPTPGIASLSSAVTQGAEVFLIKALQDVGRGQWFEVVDRVAIDSLTKERTIIRQMREAYEGKDAKPLMPLMFAGIIMEGGIIGYDSGSESGGAAYRFLGIGPQTQYSKDTVTISLRATSVNTGKVLAAVTVTKIVYSTADSVAVLKYIDNKNIASQIFGGASNPMSPTASMFEFETGLTMNEPGTLAVKATVEAAVVELIKEGERKGVWDYKKEEPQNDVKPVTTVTPPAPVAEQSVKKEETTNELVQAPSTQTPANTTAPATRNVIPVTKKETPKVVFKKSEGTITEWANLRSFKTADSQKIINLKPGTVVKIIESSNDGFYFVRHEKHEGWISKKFVKVGPAP